MKSQKFNSLLYFFLKNNRSFPLNHIPCLLRLSLLFVYWTISIIKIRIFCYHQFFYQHCYYYQFFCFFFNLPSRLRFSFITLLCIVVWSDLIRWHSIYWVFLHSFFITHNIWIDFSFRKFIYLSILSKNNKIGTINL